MGFFFFFFLLWKKKSDFVSNVPVWSAASKPCLITAPLFSSQVHLPQAWVLLTPPHLMWQVLLPRVPEVSAKVGDDWGCPEDLPASRRLGLSPPNGPSSPPPWRASLSVSSQLLLCCLTNTNIPEKTLACPQGSGHAVPSIRHLWNLLR